MSSLEWSIKDIKTASSLKSFIKENQKFMDDMDWVWVTKSQGFNMEIVDLYGDNLPWQFLCIFHPLTTKVMEKYINKLDWYAVSTFQPLTPEFIIKNQHMLSLDKLIENSNLSTTALDTAKQLFINNNDASHHKRWDKNQRLSGCFRPENFKGKYRDYDSKTLIAGSDEWRKKNLQKSKNTKKSIDDMKVEISFNYDNMTKVELKNILAERNVRTFYHDTLEILRKKCKESEK